MWNLQSGQLKQCLRYCRYSRPHESALKILTLQFAVFISWSTYVLVLGLIKISLVMFYLQIFISHRFRIIAYIVLTYIALSTIGIYLVTIFSCTPVNSFWDRDIKGRCLDINAVAYANSGSAIAQDIIILVLPLASVRKLKTNKYRKIAVGIMFAVGTLCVPPLHSLLPCYLIALTSPQRLHNNNPAAPLPPRLPHLHRPHLGLRSRHHLDRARARQRLRLRLAARNPHLAHHDAAPQLTRLHDK